MPNLQVLFFVSAEKSDSFSCVAWTLLISRESMTLITNLFGKGVFHKLHHILCSCAHFQVFLQSTVINKQSLVYLTDVFGWLLYEISVDSPNWIKSCKGLALMSKVTWLKNIFIKTIDLILDIILKWHLFKLYSYFFTSHNRFHCHCTWLHEIFHNCMVNSWGFSLYVPPWEK